jgi:hypothetical protein
MTETKWRFGNLQGFMEAYRGKLVPTVEQGTMSKEDANEIYKLIKEKCASELPLFSLIEVKTWEQYQPTWAGAHFYFSYKNFEVYNQMAGGTNFLYIRICKLPKPVEK